jgi:hypothetical protein
LVAKRDGLEVGGSERCGLKVDDGYLEEYGWSRGECSEMVVGGGQWMGGSKDMVRGVGGRGGKLTSVWLQEKTDSDIFVLDS